MGIVKKYSQYEQDGYVEERKFEKSGGKVEVTLQAKFVLEPFAMDKDKREFVIFRVDRKRDLDLFVWVFLYTRNDIKDWKNVRITAVNELMQYTKWSGEPMEISGKYPDEIIDKAMGILEDCDDAELASCVERFKQDANAIGGYKHWAEDERILLSDIKKAKEEKTKLFLMY